MKPTLIKLAYLITALLVVLPCVGYGQNELSNHYVDDRINSNNYLKFQKDGRFEFRYQYDLMYDSAKGDYKRSNDTIYLHYDKDTELLDSSEIISHDNTHRADTLLIRGHKLYRFEDGKSREFADPIVIKSKPPKSWKYRRRYLIFGPYQSTRAGRYYMIDSAYAGWNKYKKPKSAPK